MRPTTNRAGICAIKQGNRRTNYRAEATLCLYLLLVIVFFVAGDAHVVVLWQHDILEVEALKRKALEQVAGLS
jgi:hypothetical protein